MLLKKSIYTMNLPVTITQFHLQSIYREFLATLKYIIVL